MVVGLGGVMRSGIQKKIGVCATALAPSHPIVRMDSFFFSQGVHCNVQERDRTGSSMVQIFFTGVMCNQAVPRPHQD